MLRIKAMIAAAQAAGDGKENHLTGASRAGKVVKPRTGAPRHPSSSQRVTGQIGVSRPRQVEQPNPVRALLKEPETSLAFNRFKSAVRHFLSKPLLGDQSSRYVNEGELFKSLTVSMIPALERILKIDYPEVPKVLGEYFTISGESIVTFDVSSLPIFVTKVQRSLGDFDLIREESKLKLYCDTMTAVTTFIDLFIACYGQTHARRNRQKVHETLDILADFLCKHSANPLLDGLKCRLVVLLGSLYEKGFFEVDDEAQEFFFQIVGKLTQRRLDGPVMSFETLLDLLLAKRCIGACRALLSLKAQHALGPKVEEYLLGWAKTPEEVCGVLEQGTSLAVLKYYFNCLASVDKRAFFDATYVVYMGLAQMDAYAVEEARKKTKTYADWALYAPIGTPEPTVDECEDIAVDFTQVSALKVKLLGADLLAFLELYRNTDQGS